MRPIFQSARAKSIKKKLVVAFGVIAILWLSGCAAMYRIMRRPPEEFGRVMMHLPIPYAFFVIPFETLWLRARAGTLHTGDAAPDFTLTKLDKTGQVQLASFAAQGKPVALVFGSYT
jgi:hypothetical protein